MLPPPRWSPTRLSCNFHAALRLLCTSNHSSIHLCLRIYRLHDFSRIAASLTTSGMPIPKQARFTISTSAATRSHCSAILPAASLDASSHFNAALPLTSSISYPRLHFIHSQPSPDRSCSSHPSPCQFSKVASTNSCCISWKASRILYGICLGRGPALMLWRTREPAQPPQLVQAGEQVESQLCSTALPAAPRMLQCVLGCPTNVPHAENLGNTCALGQQPTSTSAGHIAASIPPLPGRAAESCF